ncbi:small polypeptide DEVIL 11-like [Lolium rigidum]|uniref:small polypeptide DEVIL 11-like n=1 Tax=Lolium rigidum TaxID=89674 RepID=UPI001F5C3D21|nr:small polypeptide DEVIL 11-like [Lolium rigidum]
MELNSAEEKQPQQPCRLPSKKRSGGKQGSDMGVRGGGKAGRPSFSGRCARLVKEQRARFYIMRRCVTMLVCWREYA